MFLRVDLDPRNPRSDFEGLLLRLLVLPDKDVMVQRPRVLDNSCHVIANAGRVGERRLLLSSCVPPPRERRPEAILRRSGQSHLHPCSDVDVDVWQPECLDVLPDSIFLHTQRTGSLLACLRGKVASVPRPLGLLCPWGGRFPSRMGSLSAGC
jgi:hypothetical protein